MKYLWISFLLLLGAISLQSACPPAMGIRAIAATNTTVNASSYAAATAVNPASNTFLVAMVINTKATLPNDPTFTGFNLTWSKAASTNFFSKATPLEKLTVFTAIAGVGVNSSAATATFIASQTGCMIRIIEVTNATLGQVVSVASDTTANPSITLAALGGGGTNGVVACFANDHNGYGGTVKAGWTEDYDAGYNSPATGGYLMYRLNTTDNVPTNTVTSASWGAIAIELAAPPCATPGVLTILTNGWQATLTMDGVTTNGTYNFGFGSPNNTISGNETVIITVSRQGFNSSGTPTVVTNIIYGTHEVRFPYPNQAFSDQSQTGTVVTLKFALSDYIYSGDSNINADILPALYSGAPIGFTNLVAVNTSTMVYPLTFGQWDHVAGVCTADRVGSTFNVAFNPRNKFGIAAVRFDATGATSGSNANVTVTSESKMRRNTGLFASSFQGSLTLTGFTTGEQVNLRARCYPKVGTLTLDTDNFTTVTDEVLGKNKSTVLFNSTQKYAYVSTNGNDSTGVASTTEATAQASPFLSIGKAVQNDATVIKLNVGNHPAVRNSPSSRRATAEWYVVQPAAGQDSNSVTVSLSGTRAYSCQRLQYTGVTVALTDASSWLDGEAADNFVRFSNCTFNHGAIGTPTTGPGYRSDACYIENCLGDLGLNNWSIQDFSSARMAYQFDGCQFLETSASATSMGPWFRIVACTGSGALGWITHATANVAPIQDGVIFDNNRFLSYNSTASTMLGLCTSVQVQITNGFSLQGNVFEKIAGTSPEIQIAADASAVVCNHAIIKNNVGTGERWNIGYNDQGSTAYDRLNWCVENNIWESLATKHDTFGTPNAARIGGWPVLYGVGWNGNNSATVGTLGASGSFMFEFIGLNSFQPSPTSGQPPGDLTGTNIVGYVRFVNRQAYDGTSGSGAGTYTVQSSSPSVLVYSNNKRPIPFDQSGNNRGGFDPSGAYSSASPRKGAGFFQ